MSKKKSKAKAKEAKPEGSKIIEQAVVYVQQLAAYDAGFMVDRTGDADFCGTGDHIGKARRAMIKLIGLSPTPLNPIELFVSVTCLVRCCKELMEILILLNGADNRKRRDAKNQDTE
jgi:hypothetical protein